MERPDLVDLTTAAWHRFLTRVRRAVRAFESERTDTQAEWTFTVRVREDELDGGWVAECVDLPGCFSQGETREEALANVSEAIAEVISLRMDQQLPTAPREMEKGGGELRRVAVGY
jgi:predicted RNase H-like HicB family nuclease